MEPAITGAHLPHSLRILVVDAHADTRTAYVSYLEQLGHTVFVAASMKEALAFVFARCSVLICEPFLPDGDGWELPKRLNASTPLYAVAATTFGTEGDREKSRRTGYRHHLLKPFQLLDLENILKEAAHELGSKDGHGQ